MDMDNVNFDSDTSESWSLIDINENGDNIIKRTDSVDETEPDSMPVICDNRSGDDAVIELCSHEPGDGIEVLHSSLDGDFFPVCSSNEVKPEQQDLQVLYKGRVFKNDENLEKKASEFNCSKTSLRKGDESEASHQHKDADNDTDCISVISESECNDIKMKTYETDEIWEDRLSDCNLPAKTHSNVLKRKRKRLKLNYRGSSEENYSSSFMVPNGKYYRSIDYKKSHNEMQVNNFPSAPVYRHYRNNVANTVLSLAMGVIFTGVACIAIGHFLGVHDAQHTAGEMMETLKRLQMENVLLHTRLTQLSRAFFSRGNAKLDLRAKEGPETCLGEYIDIRHNIRDLNEKDLHQVGPIKHPIFFSTRTVDISSGIENPSRSNDRREQKAQAKLTQQTHDQNDFFNLSKYDDKYVKIPYSATTAKSENPYKKYFPSSGNDKEKLTVVKEEEDGKVRGWKSDGKGSHGDCDEVPAVQRMNCLAIREKDLSRFRWHLLQKRRHPEPEKVVEPALGEEKRQAATALYLYKYPQPEEHYKNDNKKRDGSKGPNYTKFRLEETSCDAVEDKVRNAGFDGAELKNATRVIGDREKRSIKIGKERNVRRSVEVFSKKTKKDEKSLRKEGKHRMKEYDRAVKDKLSKIGKKAKRFAEMKNCKGDKGCEVRGVKERKRKVRAEEEEVKGKRRKMKSEKKMKKSVKAKVEEMRKVPTNRTADDCYGCWNKSGDWFCKWGKGRDRSRRDQKVRDWVFDRARNREWSRSGDANWQFLRALARESGRKSDDDDDDKVTCRGCGSGDWIYKWARGRDKCRRTRKLWERSKARREFPPRKGDGHWQFGRAMAREHSRSDDGHLHNLTKKKDGRRYSQRKGFSSFSYSWI